jgi:hypothetical protein
VIGLPMDPVSAALEQAGVRPDALVSSRPVPGEASGTSSATRDRVG